MRLRARVPLTVRGWAVTVVIIGSIALAILFGARSLNAVVAPAVVAIAVAAWQVSDVEFPAITRSSPSIGSVGERHPVEIATHEPLERIAHFADEVSEGLTADGNDQTVPLEHGMTYHIELTERGRFELGPTAVTVRDLLGLAKTTTTYANETSVLVYPRVHPVAMPALQYLAEAANITLERERHEFDRLREYQPTDSLRDIHWKTSAKRPDTDFIVKEFVSVRDRGSVIISGSAADGADDALAEAMASLASAFADAGVSVGVLTPYGKVDPVDKQSHFDRLLTNLALLGPGKAGAKRDIHLIAEEPELESVQIEVEDLEWTFADLQEARRVGAMEPDQELPIATMGEVAD